MRKWWKSAFLFLRVKIHKTLTFVNSMAINAFTKGATLKAHWQTVKRLLCEPRPACFLSQINYRPHRLFSLDVMASRAQQYAKMTASAI
jgi:hypothetical protein